MGEESKLLFLNTPFFGYGPDEARKEENSNTNRLCNIGNFSCQVKENFYKVSDRTGLLEIVESKLPYPMQQYIQTQIADPSRTKREKTERSMH